MKRMLFLTPLALVAMASCAPAPNQIQAGQWEIIREIRSMDIPGATREQLQMISQSAGQVGMKTTFNQCLSDEQARQFVQDMRRAPPTCPVSDETYANGVMRTRLTCPGQNGQRAAEMSLDGNFSRTVFNVTIDQKGPNPIGATQEPMRQTVMLRGRRTGECTPRPAPGLPGQPSQL